jgi:uncharacterized protein (DUF362 family)
MSDKVAIITCPSYEEELVTSALRQMLGYWGGMQAFVSPWQRVLLKPNLLAPDPPEKLTTTHPAVVAGVIRLVKEAGGIPLVGDRPVVGSAARVAKVAGIEEVCTRYGAQIVEFGLHQELADWQDEHYGILGTAREVLEAEVIINLPKLKAHEQLLLTLGVKNMFGGVGVGRRVRRHWISANRLEDFARMLLATYQLAPPAFTIIDGVVAMEGRGPRGGNPRQLGLLVGGPNAVATDRVVMEILSLPWQELPTLRAAEGMKVAGCDLSQIELCGSPLEQMQVSDFQLPQLLPIDFAILRSLKIILRRFCKQIFASRNNSSPKQSYLE